MIYYFTLVVFFALGFYNLFSEDKKLVGKLYLGCLVWVVLLTGLRWETATDWTSYYDFFQSCLDNTNPPFEPGYVWLNVLVRRLTDQYTAFLLLHAILLYALFGYAIYRYSDYPILSFALMFAMMLGYMGMNRQFIAMGILMVSVQFVIKRQLLPFLLCIALAMTFHLTSLPFVVAYFLRGSYNKKVYFAVLGVCVVMSITKIVNRLPLELFYLLSSDVGDKAEAYYYTFNGNVSVTLLSTLVGLAKRLVWIVLAFLYFDTLKQIKNFSLYFNLYFLSLSLFLIFQDTILQMVVSRGVLVFNLFEIFIIPTLLTTVFKDNQTRKIMLVVFLLYSAMLMQKGMSSYVEIVGYDIFNPYRCVLFE